MNERDKELAVQAGLHLYVNDLTEEPYALVVERFADLIRAGEREACADIAENWNCNGFPRTGVAAQIRARGNT